MRRTQLLGVVVFVVAMVGCTTPSTVTPQDNRAQTDYLSAEPVINNLRLTGGEPLGPPLAQGGSAGNFSTDAQVSRTWTFSGSAETAYFEAIGAFTVTNVVWRAAQCDGQLLSATAVAPHNPWDVYIEIYSDPQRKTLGVHESITPKGNSKIGDPPDASLTLVNCPPGTAAALGVDGAVRSSP